MSTIASGEYGAFQNALRGQYALERLLGRGGMGIVFLARDERLDRPVAIKVLPPHMGEDAEVRERFLREARTAAQLSHPNVVPIYRADEMGGYAFFVMAFIEGESLAERVRERGPLPPGDAVRYLREVAWALAYAHAHGVIHRDIKPENIMIERGSGRALVTDFGIARNDFNPALTQDGYVLGTAYYMSPEQIGGQPLDGRSDLYALGVVGYFLLSGRLPFQDDGVPAVLVAHLTRPAPPLASVAPDVPRAIAAVIDRCLAKDPSARYASGEALADALGKAVAANDQAVATANPQAMLTIPQERATEIWRRAAQLQAEALQRLEERSRLGEAFRGTTSDASGAYRMRDVEAAAVEAGISQQFVRLAMAEAPLSAAATAPRSGSSAPDSRATRLLLGELPSGISVARVIREAPYRTLQALGRVLQAPPWSLSLRDTIGGHPLDGGVLVFDLPLSSDAHYTWRRMRLSLGVQQLQVTIAALAGERPGTEIVLHADLRPGKAKRARASATFAAMAGALGVSAAAALLAHTAVGGPLAAGFLVGVALTLAYREAYRSSIRGAKHEMERALAAIEGSVRSSDLFGEPPSHPSLSIPPAESRDTTVPVP